MERLGDTMHTMCAARETDEQDSEEVAVLSMWLEIMFHAVRVGVIFEGGVEEETVADTGAAPLLVAEKKLSVEVLKQSLVPGRARIMHSASPNRMNAMGGAKLDFKLTGCAKNFNHEWQVIEGGTSPTILGVSFWAKYASQFDFKDRVIKMIVDWEKVQVPFTKGDEKRKETEMGAEENVALYALEDTVVPPRSGYLVPTRPEQGLKVKMGAWDT